LVNIIEKRKRMNPAGGGQEQIRAPEGTGIEDVIKNFPRKRGIRALEGKSPYFCLEKRKGGDIKRKCTSSEGKGRKKKSQQSQKRELSQRVH